MRALSCIGLCLLNVLMCSFNICLFIDGVQEHGIVPSTWFLLFTALLNLVASIFCLICFPFLGRNQ